MGPTHEYLSGPTCVGSNAGCCACSWVVVVVAAIVSVGVLIDASVGGSWVGKSVQLACACLPPALDLM